MTIFEIMRERFSRKQASEKQKPRVKTVDLKKVAHRYRASHYLKGRTGRGKAGAKLARKCAKHLSQHKVFPFITARQGRKLIARSVGA
jgi:hypothetical protein